jgi:hypothetical protein
MVFVALTNVHQASWSARPIPLGGIIILHTPLTQPVPEGQWGGYCVEC